MQPGNEGKNDEPGWGVPIFEYGLDKDEVKKAGLIMVLEGSWELMIAAIEKMPAGKQMKWKAELMGMGWKQANVWEKMIFTLKHGKTTVVEAAQAGVEQRVEEDRPNAVHRSYGNTYTETDARILMVNANFGGVMVECGVTQQENVGYLQYCHYAMFHTLPEHRTGYNEVSVGTTSREKVMKAVSAVKGMSRTLNIDLKYVPDDWKDKIERMERSGQG